MKRFLTLILIVLAVLCALSGNGGGSGEGRELSRIGRELGVDLSAGTLIRFEDNHGGFLGDGLTTAEVELDGPIEGLADAPGWKPLPLSGNAARAVSICEEEAASAEQGWYYFYDRHSESVDPYDDAKLHERYSWNFTVAVYDSQQGWMYYYKLDT